MVTALFSRIGRSDGAPKATDLILLLSLTRNFLATDPRDKVYSLLAMNSMPLSGVRFPIDYTV
jgi:hypothetical protein